MDELSPGVYVVSGSHAYLEGGSYQIAVVVRDEGSSTVAILQADIAASSGQVAGTTVQGFAGVTTGSVVVATIPAPAGAMWDYSARIDWGDGVISDGQIQAGTDGAYNVVGSHVYLLPAGYNIVVTVTDPNTTTVHAQTTALIYAFRPAALVVAGNIASDDPERALDLPLGNENVSLNTGALSVSYPLDFDMSPGISVGGDPALVYNSDTVNVRPVLELTIKNPEALWPVTGVMVQLTWDGVTGAAQSFTVDSAVAEQDSFVVAVQAPRVLTSGIYAWSASIRLQFGNGLYAATTSDGTAGVVVQDDDSRPVPLPAGWGIAGIDQIVSETLDCGPDFDMSTTPQPLLFIYGDGTSRIFDPTGTTDSDGNYLYSNSEDFGTLLANLDGTYQYTATDGTVTDFDSSGRQISVTDRDGNVRSYTYSGGQLTSVSSPDGSTTTFSGWGGTVSIAEPGRTVTLAGGSTLTSISVTSTGGTPSVNRSFGYSGELLNSDSWAPMQASIAYNSAGQVTSVTLGSGATISAYTIVSAASAALSQTMPPGPDGTATVTDALTHTTTYTMDARGRELSEVQYLDNSVSWETPQTITQTWKLNDHGDVTSYTDPLQRVTTYEYDDNGNLTRINNPDGTYESYTYNSFAEVLISRDEDGNHTYYAYADNGDLESMQDPLLNITTYDYVNGLLQSTTDPLSNTTTFTYDSNNRLQTQTAADGGVTVYHYDLNTGNPTTTISPTGTLASPGTATTTDIYDQYNQLVKETDALGNFTTWTYYPDGQLQTEQQYSAVSGLTRTVESDQYDTRGLETQSIVGEQYDLKATMPLRT